MIACLLKNLITDIKTSYLPDTNYFFKVSIVVVTVVSLTTVVVSTEGVTTVDVSLVVVVSFLSPSLQATKATVTIANAKITFFILFCLIFKIII